MSTGVQRESDGPASENRHRCFVHRGLSQDKILPVRRENAKRPTISWDDRGRPNTDTKSRSRKQIIKGKQWAGDGNRTHVLSTVSGAYRLLVLWSKVANQFDRLDCNQEVTRDSFVKGILNHTVWVVLSGIVDERGEGNWAVTVRDSNQLKCVPTRQTNDLP